MWNEKRENETSIYSIQGQYENLIIDWFISTVYQPITGHLEPKIFYIIIFGLEIAMVYW